jgi:hypothetical protein
MNLSALLHVTLTPVPRLLSPADLPTLSAAVENKAALPITILKYNSLLDNAAGSLGVVHVTDTSNRDEVPSDVIRMRKVWPPPRDAFLELAPKSRVEVEIPLRTHKLQPGRKYDVFAKWNWQGLWEGNVDVALEATSKGGVAEGTWQSTTVEVKMDGFLEVDGK